MKKNTQKISTLVFAVFLMLCSIVGVSANNSEVSFNEDFTKMYYGGNSYSRCDLSRVDDDCYKNREETTIAIDKNAVSSVHDTVTVSNTKSYYISDIRLPNISGVSCTSNKSETIFFVEIYFEDGTTLICNFLRDDYIAEYSAMKTGDAEIYAIDFLYPSGNVCYIKKELMNKSAKDISELNATEQFSVYIESHDKCFRYNIGLLLEADNKFYYADYDEYLGYYDDETSDDNSITVYEITDAETLKEIQACRQNYYNDNLGFIYDKNLSNTVSLVFFAFIFLAVPLICAIISLVLLIKSKKPVYKKIFATILTLSVLILLSVVILIFIYTKNIN